MLTLAHRHRLMIGWNDTAAEYPSDESVQELFEIQARRTPDAAALISEDRSLSYRELDAGATQLARYLVAECGVTTGSAVALCMERSPEAMIGLLAILKAGCVYVPLDPRYPQERLAFMLDDCQAPLVLTKRGIEKNLPARPRAKVLCLDRDWPAIARQRIAALQAPSTPDDVAYIVYTSGSTGTPKGVLGHQRGLVNRFHWMWQRYPFAAGEVCCQKTSLSFVDSLWELLGPLLGGVPTVIVSDHDVKNPEALVATLARYQVSRIVVVPSLLRALLEVDGDLQKRLPKLRFWVSSGEALSGDLVQRFRRGLPQSRLLNLYGSSEVAADVTCWELDNGDYAAAPVPIGRPIANTQTYILDEQLRPVPVGASGMLYVGGAGVARGYHNRDDLTAERFITHSFDGAAAHRLFKTGDLARYLPDGNIEYLGRADRQIKIRGYRIELGEIENILAQHPQVRRAAVVAQQPSDGGSSLAAYIVPRGAPAPSATALRSYLGAKLPDYMVPAVYFLLEALPLTPNGKLDIKALELAGEQQLNPEKSFAAARTDTEQRLAEIWAEVLKVNRVGIHDNFFELGGHSLLAVRLFSEIAWKLNKRLPMALLFEHPTIAQLAPLLSAECDAVGFSLVPIQPNGSKPPFFLVDTVYAYTRLAPLLDPDQPVYGLADYLGGEKLAYRSIEEMAASYIAEIRGVQARGPYAVGGHSLGALVAFEMAKQLHAQGEELALVALLDPTAPSGAESRPAMAGRIRRHRSNLAQLGFKAKVAYLRQWLQVEYLVKVANPSKSMLCGLYHTLKRRLPPKLLHFYIYEVYYPNVYYKASSDYRPSAYSGSIVCLFSEAQRSSIDTWQGLVRGGVEVHRVRGDHLGMLLEPHVQSTVEVLKHCLAKAHAGGYRATGHERAATPAVSAASTVRAGGVASAKFNVNGIFSMLSSSMPLMLG